MSPQSHLSGGSWFDDFFYQGGHDSTENFIRGWGPAGRVNPACIRLWMMRTCAPCLLICEPMLRLSRYLELRWMRCFIKIYVKMNSINGVFDTIFWPLKSWLRWNGGLRFFSRGVRPEPHIFSRGCVPNLIYLSGGLKVIYRYAFPQPKSHLGICSVGHSSRGVPSLRRRD